MYRLMLQLLFILLLLVVAFRCSAHFFTQNVGVKEEFVVEKLQQIYFESEQFVIVLLVKKLQYYQESMTLWKSRVLACCL